MIFNAIANRIVNYGVAVMVCACFSLWCVDTYVLSSKQPPSTRNIGIFTSKSTTIVKKDPTQEKGGADFVLKTSTNLNAVQKNNNEIKSKAKHSKLGQGFRDASLNDAISYRLQTHYTARILDPHYTELYKILALDNATCEALRNLLANRFMAIGSVTSNNKIMSGADALGSFSEIERIKLEYNQKIAELLGHEKFAQLNEYEMLMPTRNQINWIRGELEFSGEPMTFEQETMLQSVINKYFEGNSFQAQLSRMLVRVDPVVTGYTVSITDEQLNLYRDVLSEEQINTLVALQQRRDNIRSINYPWKVLSNQMRKSIK